MNVPQLRGKMTPDVGKSNLFLPLHRPLYGLWQRTLRIASVLRGTYDGSLSVVPQHSKQHKRPAAFPGSVDFPGLRAGSAEQAGTKQQQHCRQHWCNGNRWLIGNRGLGISLTLTCL